MIWGVGSGRKLLKCCGNCFESKRDAGLLRVKFVIWVLDICFSPPADEWSVVYASLIGLPSVFSPEEFDLVVSHVCMDEFDGSLCWSIKIVPGVWVFVSLIVEVGVCFDMCWEIVLLSPEDLYKLVIESSI